MSWPFTRPRDPVKEPAADRKSSSGRLLLINSKLSQRASNWNVLKHPKVPTDLRSRKNNLSLNQKRKFISISLLAFFFTLEENKDDHHNGSHFTPALLRLVWHDFRSRGKLGASPGRAQKMPCSFLRSMSLFSWQVAHSGQNRATMKSLHIDPWKHFAPIRSGLCLDPWLRLLFDFLLVFMSCLVSLC